MRSMNLKFQADTAMDELCLWASRQAPQSGRSVHDRHVLMCLAHGAVHGLVAPKETRNSPLGHIHRPDGAC